MSRLSTTIRRKAHSFSRSNLDGCDVVYFEHNPDAVKSAWLVGIVSYFYDNDAKDLRGLKDFLDKNLK